MDYRHVYTPKLLGCPIMFDPTVMITVKHIKSIKFQNSDDGKVSLVKDQTNWRLYIALLTFFSDSQLYKVSLNNKLIQFLFWGSKQAFVFLISTENINLVEDHSHNNNSCHTIFLALMAMWNLRSSRKSQTLEVHPMKIPPRFQRRRLKFTEDRLSELKTIVYYTILLFFYRNLAFTHLSYMSYNKLIYISFQ